MSTGVILEPRGGAPARADARAREPAGALRRTRWWIELLTIAWLCWLYDDVTELAPLRLHTALAHGRAILSAESALGIDPERTLDRWVALHHTIGLLLSDYYDNAHFIVTLGLLGWLWWKRADIYRALRSTLVLVNVLAFLVFWLFPVAPPRMLPGFTDVVAESGAFGSWHTGALASHANQLAAMPSLHIAWALWCTLVVWRLTGRAWLRAVAAVYPLVTSFAVLSTGNHYVFDVLAGALTLAVALALVRVYAAFGAPRLARAMPLARSISTVRRVGGACHKVVTKSPTG